MTWKIFDSFLARNSRCTMNLDIEIKPRGVYTYPAHYYAIIRILDNSLEKSKTSKLYSIETILQQDGMVGNVYK